LTFSQNDAVSMDPPELAEAIRYIESFLGKTFHVNTRDGRLFVGTFKCVDNENNIILSTAHEYRMPTEKAQKKAEAELAAGRGNGRADMTSRFVGLIVVPGKEITKIELEEPRPLQVPASLPVRPRGS
jgi:N-alpha-acetyltransferase 38, NatC auxiliary subunit